MIPVPPFGTGPRRDGIAPEEVRRPRAQSQAGAMLTSLVPRIRTSRTLQRPQRWSQDTGTSPVPDPSSGLEASPPTLRRLLGYLAHVVAVEELRETEDRPVSFPLDADGGSCPDRRATRQSRSRADSDPRTTGSCFANTSCPPSVSFSSRIRLPPPDPPSAAPTSGWRRAASARARRRHWRPRAASPRARPRTRECPCAPI